MIPERFKLLPGLAIFFCSATALAHDYPRPPRIVISLGAAYAPWPPFAYLEPTPYGHAIAWRAEFYPALPSHPHAIHGRYLEHMRKQFGASCDTSLMPLYLSPAIAPPITVSTPPSFEIPTFDSILDTIEAETQQNSQSFEGLPHDPADTLEILPAPRPNSSGANQ